MENEKKQIVKFFLDKGVLIDENFLKKIKNTDNLDELHSLLQEKMKQSGSFILNDEIKNTLKQTTQTKPSENTVNVVFSYEEEDKKLEVQDFIRFFNLDLLHSEEGENVGKGRGLYLIDNITASAAIPDRTPR